MGLNSILNLFISRDKIFFDLLENVAENADRMGKQLLELVNSESFGEKSVMLTKLEQIDDENNKLTRQLFAELDKNFLTPFDREDIYALAKSLGFVAHFLYGTAKKIIFYQINTQDKGIKNLAEIIDMTTMALKGAVVELRYMKHIGNIINACIKIKDLENKSDDIYDEAIEELFDNENDIKEVIKKKEIYHVMELVCDKCEDAANIIEGIIIKYV